MSCAQKAQLVQKATRLPSEFTTLAHNTPLQERFLRQSMVVLLTFRAETCSTFALITKSLSTKSALAAGLRRF